jgi:hypothetical protein
MFIIKVNLTILTNREYCIIEDPIDPITGKNKNGAQVLVKGP